MNRALETASERPQGATTGATYRYRAVVPDLPPPQAFLHHLNAAQAAGWFSNFGPLACRLETALAEAYGAPGEVCITASSATAGLSAALLACRQAGPVLLPAFTFPASASAVRAAGQEPLVMDVSPETWAIGPADLDRALRSARASAVMLVSPFGLRQDFSEQIAICRRHGAAVIIDSAAGLGVPRTRQPAQPPAQPDVWEVYSMHATKPFGVGEGGVVFAHPATAEAVRAAMNFSLQAYRRADLPAWGFNGKMSELHAAVGLAQLERFAERLAGRQAFAARYIAEIGQIERVVIVTDAEAAPWQVFPVLLPSRAVRDRMVALAAAEGLEIRCYYNPSLSQWPELRSVGPCAVSEALAERMAVLPVRSHAHDPEADAIIAIASHALRDAIKSHGRAEQSDAKH
jgi:dTDP-4-amino-4,6-dideoxygalactose transaminase